MTLQKKPASATAAVVPVSVLTIALLALAFWFLRTPAQPQFSQEQLHALAAQAEQAGPQSGKPGRQADPYKDEAVKNTIRQHALDIQKPWLDYLASTPEKTEGAITLSWVIAPDGQTAEVAVVHSDFEQVAFNEGVREAMAGIVFPPRPQTQPAGQPYSMTHRLYFKQEAEGTAAATPDTPAKATAN
jgi:hypothetical protein